MTNTLKAAFEHAALAQAAYFNLSTANNPTLAKDLEEQFGMTASMAAYIAGRYEVVGGRVRTAHHMD